MVKISYYYSKNHGSGLYLGRSPTGKDKKMIEYDEIWRIKFVWKKKRVNNLSVNVRMMNKLRTKKVEQRITYNK